MSREDWQTMLEQGLKQEKSDACPDLNLLGQYLEGRLQPGERSLVESHLQDCLYCQNRLLELQDLLFLVHHGPPLEAGLHQRLVREVSGALPSRWQAAIQWIIGPVSRALRPPWKPALALGLVMLGFLGGLFFPQMVREPGIYPPLNPRVWVRIALLDARGQKKGETFGVIIGKGNEIAVPLQPLSGAQGLEITFADRSTLRNDHLYVDETRGLARIQSGDKSFSAIKTASRNDTQIGDRIFTVQDPWRNQLQTGILTDQDAIFPAPGAPPEEVIQVVSLTDQRLRGFLLNSQGELLGLTLSQANNASFGVRLENRWIAASRAGSIPVAQLPSPAQTSQALHFYLKGLLAADAERLELAGSYLKQAVALNPRLLSARLLLGSFYYHRKKDFAQEVLEYQAILDQDPKHGLAHYHLAQAHINQGLHGAALRELEQAFALSPNNRLIASRLALLYLATNQLDKASAVINRLERSDPREAAVLKQVLQQTGRN